MNYETKNKIQHHLNPYKPTGKTVTAIFNDKLHFVKHYSFDVNSHKMKLRLQLCGTNDQSFTITENEPLLGTIIFHDK